MEWIQTVVSNSQQLQETSNMSHCQLFGCSVHGYSFVIQQDASLFSFDMKDLQVKLPEVMTQVAVSCQEERGECHYYFKSRTNVYLWILSVEHVRKRAKVESDEPFFKINEAPVNYILPSVHEPGVYMFLDEHVQHYNSASSELEITTFASLGSNTTTHTFISSLDSAILQFYSLNQAKHGLLYGTDQGKVYHRDLDSIPPEDTLLLSLEENEHVKYTSAFQVPTLSNEINSLIAIGDQGTIIVYSKSGDSLFFKQFNLQGPIHAIDKINDALFLVSSGIGRAFFLQLFIKPDSIELQYILVQGATDICYLRSFDSKHFEILCKDGTYSRVKYDSKRTLLKNNPEALSTVLKDTLREMELCEESLKSLETSEKELSEKLASVNKTLYAIRSISQKRKIGVCNSLETTGFELSVLPVTKSTSLANSTAFSSAFLRVNIKTIGFLKLESWELKLDLFPYIPYMVNNKNYSEMGYTKVVSIQGFESQYENGAEKYLMWEQDIPMDLNINVLPLKVTASLVMDSTDQNALLFPVSEMILDDLHFAMACTENMVSNIKKRGLEQISEMLESSFEKQKLSDRTNQYILEKVLKEHTNSATRSYPFDYKRGVIRILVNPQMSEETYRCILSKILNDGRTAQDIKQIIYDAERAYYILAAFPASPIVLTLSRFSDTELELRFECQNPIALFKNEASLLVRLYFMSLTNKDQENWTEKVQNADLLEELRALEETIISLQDQYHQSSKNGSVESDGLLWDNLKKAVEKMEDLHRELPACYIEFN